MKGQAKKITMFLFLGGIMATSGVVIGIPGVIPEDPLTVNTKTDTPQDTFPDVQRPRFCGSWDAKSTEFIREYAIPTICTNPLAITTDPDGKVWFVQSNGGTVGMFDPETEAFEEYENDSWGTRGISMVWGADYVPDGSVWFTDASGASVWRFSVADQEYTEIEYPSEGNSLPQRLKVDGSQIIINDFNGNKITFSDPSLPNGDPNYISVPSRTDGSLTADFAVDGEDNIWYTNWLPQSGTLVRFNQTGYFEDVIAGGEEFLPVLNYTDIYTLPANLPTPNGITIDGSGKVWMANTSSSAFFSFDPATERFSEYVTAPPTQAVYGNQTGISLSPTSNPYWMESMDNGSIVFNPHASNNISVLDPASESLVEYLIPSQNPFWSDCGAEIGEEPPLKECGLAQAFGIAPHGDKVWFTEWVENNIGVVDTSVPLPASVEPAPGPVTVSADGPAQISFTVTPSEGAAGSADIILNPTDDLLQVGLAEGHEGTIDLAGGPVQVQAEVTAMDTLLPDTYRVLVGVQAAEVAISKFVTVTVT